MTEFDYKEYARQMRENCAKDYNGNILCSGELWDELANTIESFSGCGKQKEGENITEMHPVDEFICSECGLVMRDCCRYEFDEDDGDEICYEFAFKFCPLCGMKVIENIE